MGVAAVPAWWEEFEEESGGSGGPEASGVAAPAVGEWRSVRAAALCDVGGPSCGSLGGQGKEAESERRIATRFVEEGRARVDEARTRVDPGGLADNHIHRLVRVTA